MKERLDLILVREGFFGTREKAKRARLNWANETWVLSAEKREDGGEERRIIKV